MNSKENPPSQKQNHLLLSSIRQLVSKTCFTSADIFKLIHLISQNHISVFAHFSDFFIKFRNELVLSDFIYKEKLKKTPRTMKLFDCQIQISQFFNQGRMIDRQSLAILADTISKKISFYISKDLSSILGSQFYSKPATKSLSLASKIKLSDTAQQMDNNELILRHIFPSAHKLQKTIKKQINFMKQFYLFRNQKQQRQENFAKDELVVEIVEKIRQQNKVVNFVFNKEKIYESQPIHFTDDQFYNIKEFIEVYKFHAQCLETLTHPYDLNQKKAPEIDSFEPIPANCAGCVPFMYKNHTFPRQRCSVMNFEAMNTIDDKKDVKKLKKLVQAFINSPNGGIIYFDVIEEFFGIIPKGLKSELKKLQSKKQSLIDIVKNYFPQLKVNKELEVDFILLKDPENMKSQKDMSQSTMPQSYFIGRLKILKQSHSLITNQEQNEKKSIIERKICMNHYVKQFDQTEWDELKSLQTLRKDPKIFKTINENNNNQLQKLLKCLQGRSSTIFRHQEKKCKEKPSQGYQMVRQNEESDKSKLTDTQLTRDSTFFFNEKGGFKNTALIEIDNQFKHWCLLIASISEIQKIESHLKFYHHQNDFDIEAPFQDNKFSKANKTLLIKMKFTPEVLVSNMFSEQSIQKNLFRTFKKESGYSPLTYIKVYDHILVAYSKRPSNAQLIELRDQLVSQMKRYFKRLYSKNSNAKGLRWVQYLDLDLFAHPNKSSIYITTNDYHPSYGLLFIYYCLKNELSQKKNYEVKRVEFKQSKDFNREKDYKEVRNQMTLLISQ